MNILVTGGCGFLGSHFVRAWLSQNPHGTLTNIDCLTYAGSLDNLEDTVVDPRHTHLPIDIADQTAMASVADASFDLVVHFAAETHVDRSLEDSRRFVRTNVVGTQTLLATVARMYVRGVRPPVIIVSTDEVYGPTPDGVVFGPDQPLAPTSPYASSKALADMIALAYAESLDLDLTIVRSVNVYGPRQFPEKVIPLFTARALAGEQLPLYGDGRQRRSWLHVDDFVAGLTAILGDHDKRRAQPIWHLGSTDELENRTIAAEVCRVTDSDPALITRVTDRPGHDRRYALDFSITTDTFGWTPQVPLMSGLAQTIRWFSENTDWCRSRTNWAPAFIKDG